MKLSYDPAIPLLGIHSREILSPHRNLYECRGSIIHNSPKVEIIQTPSTDEQIHKYINVVNVYNRMLLGNKNEKNTSG